MGGSYEALGQQPNSIPADPRATCTKNGEFELPEDLQRCDKAALPLSHTKLSVRGGT